MKSTKLTHNFNQIQFVTNQDHITGEVFGYHVTLDQLYYYKDIAISEPHTQIFFKDRSVALQQVDLWKEKYDLIEYSYYRSIYPEYINEQLD